MHSARRSHTRPAPDRRRVVCGSLEPLPADTTAVLKLHSKLLPVEMKFVLPLYINLGITFAHLFVANPPLYYGVTFEIGVQPFLGS